MDKKYTVLIADDDPSLRKGMEVKFKSKGYNVITASDGEEAINNALEQKPDLIIMDQLMPKFTGLAAIKHIRADFEWGRHVPIIVMTNVAEGTSAHRELILVSTRYFVKSNTSLDTLIKTANELLGVESDSSSDVQDSENSQVNQNDSDNTPKNEEQEPQNAKRKTKNDHPSVDNNTSPEPENTQNEMVEENHNDDKSDDSTNSNVVINTSNDSSSSGENISTETDKKTKELTSDSQPTTTENASANNPQPTDQTGTDDKQNYNENSDNKFDSQAL